MAISFSKTSVYDLKRKIWTKFTSLNLKDKPRTLTAGLQVDNVNLFLNNQNNIDKYPGVTDTAETSEIRTKEFFMGKGLVDKFIGDYSEKSDTALSVVVKNENYPTGKKEHTGSASTKTRRIAVIQPGNKSLYGKNKAGKSLWVDSATMVLRVNATTVPTEGTYLFRYKTDTAKMEISIDGGNYSGDYSVTSDGSTFNDDMGSRGIDFIAQSNPKKDDEFEVIVINNIPNGEDTYLDETGANINKNYGVTTTLAIGDPSGNALKTLMRFNLNVGFNDIPGNTSLSSFTSVKDSFLRFYETATPDQLIAFHEISDVDGDWFQGTKDGATSATGEPDWAHRRHTGSNWDGGSGLPAFETLAATLQKNVTATGFVEFHDSNGILNTLIAEWFKLEDADGNSQVNNGLLSVFTHTSGNVAFASSEYSTNLSRIPMLVFIYDTTDTTITPRIWRSIDLAKKRGRSFYIKLKNVTDLSWFRIKFTNIGGRD